MNRANIDVSLFIDPNLDDIKAAKHLGVNTIELHTGSFANAYLMAYSNISKLNLALNLLKIKMLKSF